MRTSESGAEDDGGAASELELSLEGGASEGDTGMSLDAGESVNV